MYSVDDCGTDSSSEQLIRFPLYAIDASSTLLESSTASIVLEVAKVQPVSSNPNSMWVGAVRKISTSTSSVLIASRAANTSAVIPTPTDRSDVVFSVLIPCVVTSNVDSNLDTAMRSIKICAVAILVVVSSERARRCIALLMLIVLMLCNVLVDTSAVIARVVIAIVVPKLDFASSMTVVRVVTTTVGTSELTTVNATVAAATISGVVASEEMLYRDIAISIMIVDVITSVLVLSNASVEILVAVAATVNTLVVDSNAAVDLVMMPVAVNIEEAVSTALPIRVSTAIFASVDDAIILVVLTRESILTLVSTDEAISDVVPRRVRMPDAVSFDVAVIATKITCVVTDAIVRLDSLSRTIAAVASSTPLMLRIDSARMKITSAEMISASSVSVLSALRSIEASCS